jgi:hypothetical protein
MSIAIVTEIKKIKVQSCALRPIYLRWLNRLGGFDYWCFEKQQEYDYQGNNALVYKTYIQLLSIATGTHRKNKSQGLKLVTLGCEGVTENQFNTLTVLQDSPRVQIKIDSVWRDCVVGDASNVRNTDDPACDFELQLILPELFTQKI